MNLKRLTILTVTLNFFIIIAADHGIACIGLFEIIGLRNFYQIGGEDFSLSLAAEYEKSLGAAALFAFIGNIVFIVSICLKKDNNKYWSKIIGIIFFWISFYYLIHNLFTDDLAQISFFSGLPFLISSIILWHRLKKERKDFLEQV